VVRGAVFALPIALLAVSPLPASVSPAPERFLLAQALRGEGDLVGALAELERALAAAPADPYLRLERARLLFDLGRIDEASAEIAAARAGAPEEVEALRLQGRIEMARAPDEPDAVESALEAFGELRRRDPNDVEVLVSLGQLYLAGGRAELAAEALDEALRLRPGNGWIESLRARAVAALDDEDAVRLQGEALRRDPNLLAARLELAERLGRAGRNAEAAALLEAAPEAQKSRPELTERLARQLHFAGETERALPLAEAAVAARPHAPGARRLLGRIGIALGRFAAAEEALAPLAAEALADEAVAELLLRALEGQGKVESAAELLAARRDRFAREAQPRLALAAELDRARLWLRHRRFAEAAGAAAEVAAARDPELAGEAVALRCEALAAAGLGQEALAVAAAAAGVPALPPTLTLELLLALGREQEAGREAARLLAAAPGLELRVGAAYHEHERWAEAEPLLEAALAAEPESLEATFRLAACSERLGKIERAVELFRAVLARAPRFAAALNYLGYLWIERAENLDQALALVGEAVRLDPASGAYVDSLGWGLFRLGRFAEAVRTLERASRLLPDDATVHEHLGDARAAAGDRAGASASYRRALELEPEAPGPARKLAELGGGT
jgi:tetratricopeptide (TPR) repeat protein